MDNSKYTQCNFISSKKFNVKSTQTLQIKRKTALTQTIKVAKPRFKTRNVQSQCMLPEANNHLILRSLSSSIKSSFNTEDRTTQTLTLMVNNSSETDDKVTFPFVKGIITSFKQSITTPYFQDIIAKCKALGLHIRFSTKNSGNFILVTNPKSLEFFNEGIDVVQVYITESGMCTSVIPFCKTQVKQIITIQESENTSTVTVDYEYLDEILDFLRGVNVAFCPGIISNHDYAKGLKNVEKFEKPFPRLQSVSCPVLYRVETNSKKRQCRACYISSRTLTTRKKRKRDLAPNTKEKRTKVESNYPMKFLNPKSKQSRLDNIKRNRRALIHRISKLESQIEHKEMLLNPVV